MKKRIIYYLALVLVFVVLWAIATTFILLVGGKNPSTIVMCIGIGVLFAVFRMIKPIIKKKIFS